MTTFYYNTGGNPWHRIRDLFPLTPASERPELPEFALSPRVNQRKVFRANVRRDWRRGELRAAHRAPKPAISIMPFMIDLPAPSLPVGANSTRKPHRGKADPVWGRAFRTKFSRAPKAEAQLVTPKGALNVIETFVSKAAELDYLINTQHLELATTQQTLAANGIASVSLSRSSNEEYDDAPDITEADVVQAESLSLDPQVIANVKESHGITDAQIEHLMTVADPTFAALMARRIEWEQYIFASGPIHTARFSRTEQGGLGIDYVGAKKFATPEATTATRKALKNAWLDRVGPLPSPEEIENARAWCAHHANKPVLAHMSESERDADTNSRRFGAEDPDPERIAFHAENPRTAKWTECFDREGNFDGLITDDLPGGIIDVGYAGPSGLLGLDDEDDDEDFAV